MAHQDKIKCENCGKELKGNQRRWCSNKCSNKGGRTIKRKFIKSFRLNSSCSFCGYKEHPEILQFHHLIPLKRKWGASGSELLRSVGCANINRIKEELKKVILLCPNCHSWLHYKD